MAENELYEVSHQSALPDATPKIYANGFSLALSNADCNLTLVRNGEPQVSITLSYTTAKTLAIGLGRLISSLEEATGREMMTADVVEQALERASAEQSS